MNLSRLFNIGGSIIRRTASTMCHVDNSMIVTVLGSCAPTGRTLTLLLKQCMGIDEIRLYGQSDDVCSAALDMSHIDTNTKIRAFKGDSTLFQQALQDSKIVVICGGDPMNLSENQESLFYKNVDTIKYYALHIAEFCPKAIVLVHTPPVDAFVPLICEEFKKANTYDPRKIIGLCNENCIIASSHVAKHLKVNPTHVLCPVIGGTSPFTMVPVLSQATPTLELTSEEATEMYSSISTAKTRMLEKKFIENDDHLYIILTFAACRFIKNVIKAIKGDRNCTDVAFVRQTGHIDDFLPYMASIVRLGPNGAEETFMPKLNEREQKLLMRAHPHTKYAIDIGRSFVTGETLKFSKPREEQSLNYCDTLITNRVDVVGDVVVNLSKKYRNFEIHT